MKNHAHQPRCYELITESTRLRMSIDMLEARPDADDTAIRLEAARQWARFHRSMIELLALTPAHDREGARRQQATALGHEKQQLAWGRMVEQLEGQARLDQA